MSDLFSRLERKLATSRERPRLSAKGPRAKLLFANKGGQWPFIIPNFLLKTRREIAFIAHELDRTEISGLKIKAKLFRNRG